jgi:hypothetical protein
MADPLLPVNFAGTHEVAVSRLPVEIQDKAAARVRLGGSVWDTDDCAAQRQRAARRRTTAVAPVDLAIYLLLELRGSGMYDRTLTEIAAAFSLERAHLRKIASAVSATLTGEEPAAAPTIEDDAP